MSALGFNSNKKDVKKLNKERKQSQKIIDRKARADKIRDRQAITKDRERRSSQILAIVFVVMLLAVVIRFAMGSESIPTFTGFLETITSAPEINIPFLTQTTGIIMADWGIFNFLRDFINTFMQIIDVIIFFINGILSVLTYVVYFFRWLFIA